jgi:glycogen(starch) synthase
MSTLTNGLLDNGRVDFGAVEPQVRPVQVQGRKFFAAEANGHPRPRDAEFLRCCAWEIGEKKAADAYAPTENHTGLAAVTPYQGFAHWRILHEWVDRVARDRGDAWHHCRLILRLYDASCIQFNGLNAHRIQDQGLPGLCGQTFFRLPRPGTWQIAEVGFLLRNGEFIPAARSQSVPFPADAASSRGGHTALWVTESGRVEEVGNLWEQERLLSKRRKPKLRQPLRFAAFAFAAQAAGQEGVPARFVSELAAGQCARGHEAHVFVPASPQFHFNGCRQVAQVAGVHYHPLDVCLDGTPLDQARAFGRAAEKCLEESGPFDLVHLHEWMTGLVPRSAACPMVVSFSSTEATRRNGAPPGELSPAIEEAEREVARTAACVLTPPWLRDRAVAELGLDGNRVRAFPMEGRMPNEWEAPLDFGQVKKEIGFGPLDRLILFVGPLEHAAGVDILLEALPVLLQRCGNLRLAYAGAGNLYGHLQHRAYQLGVAHAMRLLGHVESWRLTGILRSAEALVLPSRYRVPFDDAVVDLARRAGRPVVTTHGGPAHLVRHEHNGILTYDNPGSMVWAVDRILGDPGHAERMGKSDQRREDAVVVWSEVARHYLDLCAACFPELTETQW